MQETIIINDPPYGIDRGTVVMSALLLMWIRKGRSEG